MEFSIRLNAVSDPKASVRAFATIAFGESFKITNVAVAPMYQNQGVGRRMLEHLLEQARQSGIRRIFLEVRISNENAIRLYRKLGFGNCGIRKGLYQFPREDGMVMVWEQ